MTLNQLIAIIVGVVLFALSGSTIYYRHELNALHDSDLLLKHDNEVAQQQAATKLNQLTEDRDKAQKLQDQQDKDQEIKDAQAQSDISTLHDKLLHTPIRVQYVSSPASNRCATSDQITDAANRAGNETTASGVLPESNTRRLADALMKVGTLSAAYNSCRTVGWP